MYILARHTRRGPTRRSPRFSQRSGEYSPTAFKDVSHRVKLLLSSLRQLSPKHDDGPKHYALMKSNPPLSRETRAVIGIRTRGCTYARSPWGGCSVCGHAASTLWDAHISDTCILEDFYIALDAVKEYGPTTLCLYTSGSFLDENELPSHVRDVILEEAAKIGATTTIAIESIPTFVTPPLLDSVLTRIGSKRLRIGMGLDTANDFVRSLAFQRALPSAAYHQAVHYCRKKSVETTAYLVFGHPFLPPPMALYDTSDSIRRAFSLGFSSVSIEPVALQPGTLQAAFSELHLYQPPSIWDICDLLSLSRPFIEKKADRLVLGGQMFTPLPYSTVHACCSCRDAAMISVPFMAPSFWAELPIVDFGRCCFRCESEVPGPLDPSQLLIYIEDLLESYECAHSVSLNALGGSNLGKRHVKCELGSQ